jgi:hypothetical protein
MKSYPFATVAALASSPLARDRFAAMAHGNRMCPRKTPSVLAGIEGWQLQNRRRV